MTGPDPDLIDPEPEPGCPECTQLSTDRQQARTNHDFSRAVDCNVLLRRHLAADHDT
jgi:hypothetical protein